MNISEIKADLNVTALPFKWNVLQDKTISTDWLRCWDNATRQDIHMHREVMEALSQDKDMSTLHAQKESKTTDKGTYTFVRIVMFDAIVTY
jgi:hypothetical protein